MNTYTVKELVKRAKEYQEANLIRESHHHEWGETCYCITNRENAIDELLSTAIMGVWK